MTTDSNPDRYDVAVVGLGLVGAAALRHLSTEARTCIGIGTTEPSDWSTHRGVFASHYDSGRITRRLDKRREWAMLAARAIEQYPQIELASGIRFHHPVGLLMAEVDPARLAAVAGVAADLGIVAERFEAGEPYGDDRVAFPAGATVFREPAPAGFIDPRRMAAAQLAVAGAQGAHVVAQQVLDVVRRSAGGWAVRTADGAEVQAEQVVIATGPHADELPGLASRPLLDVVAETVVLARVPAEELEGLAGLPSIMLDDPSRNHLYIVPPTDYPDGHVYIKLGATRGKERMLTPDQRRAWMSGNGHEADLPWLRGLLLEVLPRLRADAWLTKPCLVPDTPSTLPYIEIVDDGCVMAVGSNGYAAKSADAIGALAAGLVTNGKWTDPELDEAAFAFIPAPEG